MSGYERVPTGCHISGYDRSWCIFLFNTITFLRSSLKIEFLRPPMSPGNLEEEHSWMQCQPVKSRFSRLTPVQYNNKGYCKVSWNFRMLIVKEVHLREKQKV